MKELSIEEKAKAYDEALKVLHKYDGANIMFSQSLKEEMFPELKESEDERIRKELIKETKGSVVRVFETVTNEEFIAWLEKQGKNNMGISEATKQELKDNLNNALAVETGESWNEFLDEQKSVDKVEPKFKIKEGKWYICISQFCNCIEGRVYKATSDSRIIDDFGTEFDIHNDAYKYFRLWTIQDAKAGDVLAADPIKGIEGFSSSFIAIYKKRNGEDFDSYCFVGFNGKFDKIGIEHSTDRVHPATKEQRDLLFQKMEEAGYEWNAEERKLEEIKYNKAKWKNHDEEMIKGIRNFIGFNQDLVEGGVDEWLDWLKNFENKMQLKLKQEWSEDDEKAINDIMWIIEAYRKNGFNETHKQTANNAEKWLKSIKDRVSCKVDYTTTKNGV